MIIYHNIPALNSWRNLSMTNNSMAKSLEKLASGLRINRAADDAAGLAISEKMRAQIRGLNQSIRNAQDGVSLIQTAEGALNETHSILQRMRELAVQAASDGLTSGDGGEIQKEINRLVEELNRIAKTTEFNTKKLLDGSTSALVSSDRTTTRIFMRDGLRTTDQYGQKITNSGNYELKIGIKELGQAEVQKSDIFNVKHAYNGIENLKLGADGTNNTMVGVRNYVAGGYTLGASVTGVSASFSAKITQQFLSGSAGSVFGIALTAISTVDLVNSADNQAVSALNYNYNSLVEVTNIVNHGNDKYDVTYMVSTHRYGIEGNYEFRQASTTITLSAGNTAISTLSTGFKDSANDTLSFKFDSAASYENLNLIKVGDKAIVNAKAQESSNANTYTLTGTAAGEISAHNFTQAYINGYFDKTQRTFNLYSLDAVSGKAYNGSITIGFDYDYAKTMAPGSPLLTVASGDTFAKSYMLEQDVQLTADSNGKTSSDIFVNGKLMIAAGTVIGSAGYTLTIKAGTRLDAGTRLTAIATVYDPEKDQRAVFDVSSALGRAASLDTRLYDIDKFWDASGNFILTNPQRLTFIQGDGKRTTITMDSNDTIFSVQEKINNAIRDGLGQGAFVDSSLERSFVKFVYNKNDAAFKDMSGYSVNGTFVIQSAIAGKAGEIRLAGDDDILINAFSLANIRNAGENTFNVWYKDAHSTTPYDIAPNTTVAGNLLVGVIHPNVDIMFDSNAGIKTVNELNTATGLFMFKAETNANNFHTTTVHLAENTLVFQIGANPNQDVNASIGDMSAIAMGVDNVLLTDRESATGAFAKIDAAINRVSGERAKMGALQNRLICTINNLGVASENLSAAESRIRDVDMAAEMMNLTRQQILAQAGTAMMVQANNSPQMVLRLLGG